MTEQSRPVPGRIYLLAVAACFAAAAVIGAAWVLHGTRRLAGTDSVNPSTVVATLKPGQRLCVRDLVVPRDASTIRFQLGPAAGKPVDASIALRTVAGSNSSATVPVTAPRYIDFPLRLGRRTAGATACLRSSGALAVWGSPFLPATARPQAFFQGKPLTAARVSVWFWGAHNRSLLSLLPRAAHRATVFRAGFVGPWTYLLLLFLIPLMWWLGLRALLRGVR